MSGRKRLLRVLRGEGRGGKNIVVLDARARPARNKSGNERELYTDTSTLDEEPASQPSVAHLNLCFQRLP